MSRDAGGQPPHSVIDYNFSMIQHLDMISNIFCSLESLLSTEVKGIWGERYKLDSGNRTGWKALWYPPSHLRDDTRFCTEMVVEVKYVRYEELLAFVCVLDANLGFKSTLRASLIELFPIDEDFPFIASIAKCLSHLRFFYLHVWLPWDDDAEIGCKYNWVHNILMPRLELFRDMHACKIPSIIVNRIRNCLKDGRSLYRKLVNLREENENIDVENPEDVTVKMSRLLQTWDTELDFKAKRKEIQLLENAVYRTSMIKKFKTDVELPGGTFHIVSHQTLHEDFRQRMETLQCSIPKDGFVLFHMSLEDAVCVCNKTDTVHMFPGTYSFRFPSFKCGVIKGHSNLSEVTVILTNQLVVSLEGTATYEELTIKAVNNDCAAIFIERGSLSLKNCRVIGNGENSGLKVLPGCVLELTGCKIENFLIGIEIFPNGCLYMDNCVIERCVVELEIQNEGKVFTVK